MARSESGLPISSLPLPGGDTMVRPESPLPSLPVGYSMCSGSGAAEVGTPPDNGSGSGDGTLAHEVGSSSLTVVTERRRHCQKST